MTAVTIQSNKIVWSDGKDNEALLENSYTKELCGQPQRRVPGETGDSIDLMVPALEHPKNLRCNE